MKMFQFARDTVQHVVFASRLARRQRTVAAVTLVGLAVAIGFSAATFSVVDALAFRPGVPDPSSIVYVWRRFPNGAARVWAYGDVLALHERARLMTPEIRIDEQAVVSAAPGEIGADRLRVDLVSGTYLTTFGASAAVGRLLTPDDDRSSAPPVAVLAYNTWGLRFDKDPSIVGRVVHVAGAPVTIVGVTERFYEGPPPDRGVPALWMPLGSAHAIWPGHGPFGPSTTEQGELIARIAPGVGMPEAEAEISSLVSQHDGAALSADVPERRAVSAELAPAAGPGLPLGLIASVVGALLLLILVLASVNAAIVQLANAATRQREFAMRMALGASRGRIVHQLLTESLMLGVAGGALGLLVGTWVAPILASTIGLPATLDVAPDLRLFAYVSLASLLVGLAAGVLPARAETRGDLPSSIGGDAIAGMGRGSSRRRSCLIGAQAAASLVLLVFAALFVRALVRASTADVGMDVDRLVMVSANFRPEYGAAAESAYLTRAARTVGAMPGVAGVAFVSPSPLLIEAAPPTIRFGHRVALCYRATSPDFFAVTGVRIVRGRIYDAREVANHQDVAVISSHLASLFWGAEDPIGATLGRVDADLRNTVVIGVAAEVTKSFKASDEAEIYQPLRAPDGTTALVVRASGDGVSMLKPVLAAVAPIDRNVRASASMGSALLDRELVKAQQFGRLAGIISALALGLSAMGVFGASLFGVAVRTREIAVRMAVGADRRDIARLLIVGGLRPVVLGMAAGLVPALLATRVLGDAVLLGIAPGDPFALAMAICALLFVAAFAILIPARRATRIDPAVTLR